MKDGRTGRDYEISIQHNAVKAADFSQIKVPTSGAEVADATPGGLR